MVITIMMVIMVMIVRSWPRELCFDIDTKLLLNPDHIKMFMITKRANLTQMMIVMKVMIITAGSRKLRLSLCHRLQRQERVAAAPTCSGDHHYCVCVCTFAKSKFACVCACSSNCLLNLNTQKHIHARTQTQNYITQLQRMSSTLKQREKPKLRQLLSDIQTPTCCPELTVLLASASCCSSSPFSTDSNYDICIIVAVLVLLLQTLIMTLA